MELNDYDKFLVNDGTTTETISLSLLRTNTAINDSDLFLINDGTKTETVTWGEIQNFANPSPIITSVTLAPDDYTGPRFTNQSFTTTVVMQNDGIKSIRGTVTGAMSPLVETDEIIRVLEITPGDPDTNKDAILNIYFASDKGLDLLSPGDFIQQSDNMTSGEILGVYPDQFSDPLIQIVDKSAYENWNLYTPSNIKVGTTPPEMFDGQLYDQTTRAIIRPLKDLEGSYTWAPPSGFPCTSKCKVFLRCGGSPTDINQFRIIDTDGNVGAWTPKTSGVGDRTVTPPFPSPYNGLIGRLEALTTGTGIANARPDGVTTGDYNRLQIYGLEVDNVLLVKVPEWGPVNTGLYGVAQISEVVVSMYLNLDSDLNVTSLSETQTDFTLIPNNILTPQLKFGLTLGTVDAPDDVLPDGTTIQTEILATKGAETDSMKSSMVLPNQTVYTPLYLQNPEDVIKFNTIKTALDEYEEDLQQYHVNLTQRLYTTGFNTAELSAMNLPN